MTDKMLATINFVRPTSYSRGEQTWTEYYRDWMLNWSTWPTKRNCKDCDRVILPGEKLASNMTVVYCQDCVTEMTKSDAMRGNGSKISKFEVIR